MKTTTNITLDIINDAFNQRKLKNPYYSLRAFARDVGISPGQMSRILAGKRLVSTEHACRIALNLKLEPTIFMEFLSATLIEAEQIGNSTFKAEAELHTLSN